MKRRIGLLVFLLLFFLSGCTGKDGVDTRIQVSLWATEGVTVHVSITDEKSVVAAFAVAEKIN